MAFQAFIKGTGFDVANAMSFNYVIDVIDIGGQGAKGYDMPGCTLKTMLMNVDFAGTQNAPFQVNVNGMVVSWNVYNVCKLVVFATPDPGANTRYNGFSHYDYSSGVRTVKLAPDFIPFNLRQVIDFGGGQAGAVIQSNVPVSQPIVAFHRSIDSSGMDETLWSEVNQNGYWSFRLIHNTRSTRIYIFSKELTNIPYNGFFIYRNGQIVWHSNCLPLRMIQMTGAVTSGSPLAISNGFSANIKTPSGDPQFPNGYVHKEMNAAGVKNGVWTADGFHIFQSNYFPYPEFNKQMSWIIGGACYIDCAIYDAYYRQALGV